MAQSAAYNRKWRHANPDKARAHAAVNAAIRIGTLVKRCCEVCGDPMSDAHHDDYSKPLEVRWLCDFHHKQVHFGEAGDRAEAKRQRDLGRRKAKYVKRPRRLRSDRKDEASRLKQSGMSLSQIGDEMKLSKSQVSKILRNPDYK